MNSFLLFAIIALLGFSGYEYYQHTQDVAAFIQQRDTLTASIAQLQKSNAALKANQSALTDKLSSLQSQASAAPAAPAAPTTPSTPPSQ